MRPLTLSRIAGLRVILGLALVATSLAPAIRTAAPAPGAVSAEDILKGLAGADETPRTRGVGGLKTQPRPESPSSAAGGGRIAVPIRFKYDSAEITPDSFDQLRVIAEALLDPRLQDARILVEGHTDNQGSAAYNLALSERRAGAVKRFLVEKASVPAARLDYRGYGKSRPLPGVSQDTEEGRALNRRVELVNLGTGSTPEATRPTADARPKVAMLVSYERDGQTRTLAAGGVLAPTDRYRVTFTPTETSYVYVYQLGPTRTQPLFPNAERSSATNPVRGGQSYHVPPEGQWLRLDETPGDEELVVVAAAHELTDALAIATRVRAQRLTAATRGPAPAPRGDVAPEAPAGVVAYRVPLKH